MVYEYPPGPEASEKLFARLKQLDATTGVDYNPKKYKIIHDLAEAHFYKAKPYFIAGLDSPDPDYRWACISALATHWQDADELIVNKLLSMAEDDPDVQVRMIVVSALGRSLQIKESLPTLKRIIENRQEDIDVRKIAYLSYTSIPGHASEERLVLDDTLLAVISVDESDE